MNEVNTDNEPGTSTNKIMNISKIKKQPKKGIIYLSTIPPFMNVTQITEFFSDFGKVGRVYLQLADTGNFFLNLFFRTTIICKILEPKPGEKTKKRKIAKKFTEGWVEFQRKSVAKKVATLLNNTQISNRKKSKHYDVMWNMKYLSNFKWTHLHERLAYEKAARRQKLRTEIELAKKKTNFFTVNLDKGKKKKPFVNKELQSANTKAKNPRSDEKKEDDTENRSEFLESLFN